MSSDKVEPKRPKIEVKPSGIAVVRDDFETGLNPQIWSAQKLEPGHLTFESLGGISVARIEIHQGDRKEVDELGNATERDELLEQKALRLPLSSDAWYAFSFYFPPDFPIVDNRTVFAQWKQTGENGSPFLSLRYQEGRMFCKVIGEEVDQKFRLSAQELRGQWHRMIMNYQLNPNLSGKVRCLIDDQELVDYEGPMGHLGLGDSTYFKMGLYRDKLEIPQAIYLAQYRRGLSYEDCQI